ncbi:MAG TPA: (d)CMP kinase [Polyangia bacterium]|jgi:cytidylate kinase
MSPPSSPSPSPSSESSPTSGAQRLVVTIDGPAGAGKSTTAKLLAERLGYALLDTGAIYRTLALTARGRGVSWQDGPSVAALAADLDIRFRFQEGVNRVYLGADDVTAEIRAPEISDGASRVSALPEVRAALLDLQRRLAAAGGVVVEGRDVGTVVFPQAGAKFFLTAAAAERAHRRATELRAAGRVVDEQAVLDDIVTRDDRDTNRAVAPLRKADDALQVDSDSMTPAQVVDLLLSEVRRRGG